MGVETFSVSQWLRDQWDEDKYNIRLLTRARVNNATLSERVSWEGGVIAGESGNGFGSPLAADWTRGEPVCLVQNLVAGGSPLRNRLTYAIQQFVVCSIAGGQFPWYVAAAHWDHILLNTAAGKTITDVLQAVSLSVPMAIWLTFWGKTKANPATGVEPDENYARELPQLFSIGLHLLNEAGKPLLDGEGNLQETYTPTDISQFARVFTGFVKPGLPSGDYVTPHARATELGLEWSAWTHNGNGPEDGGNPLDPMLPLECIPAWHEWGAKNFIGISIPAVTDPELQTAEAAREEVRYAVAELCKHPNTVPFWARRLVQFLVTENPSDEYVEYVTAAGRAGKFILPDETEIGSGEEGDLQAMACAIFCHAEAHTSDFSNANSGRIPSIFDTHIQFLRWHSIKEALYPPDTEILSLRDLWQKQTGKAREYAFLAGGTPMRIARFPLTQPSVFGFGAPHFVATGTPAGAAGLSTPGLQNFNWTSYASVFNHIDINPSPPYDGDWGDLATSCMRGDELMKGVPALNADMIADSDDYVDRINRQCFAGRLSAPTVALMKLHAARRVFDDDRTDYRFGVSPDPEDGNQLGGAAGVYTLGAMSVEGAVRR